MPARKAALSRERLRSNMTTFATRRISQETFDAVVRENVEDFDMDAAEADLLKAIEIEPGNAAAYASLARIYNSMGKASQVTETLQKGLTLNDRDVSLRLTQAMQLEYEGQFDDAIEV